MKRFSGSQSCSVLIQTVADSFTLYHFLIVYESSEICLYLASVPEAHHQIIRHWQLVSVFLSDLSHASQADLQTDTHTKLSNNSQLVRTAYI